MKRFAVLLLTTCALLGLALPASAHTKLESSDPADGSTLDGPPENITLTFSELVQAESSAVTVTGPSATEWSVGSVSGKGPVLTVPVTPAGPAGEYAINYAVRSLDGHTVNGSVRFTLTQEVGAPAAPLTPSNPAAPANPPAASTPVTEAGPAPASPPVDNAAAESGMPVWPWIAGGVVLLLLLGGALVLRSRRSN